MLCKALLDVVKCQDRVLARECWEEAIDVLVDALLIIAQELKMHDSLNLVCNINDECFLKLHVILVCVDDRMHKVFVL